MRWVSFAIMLLVSMASFASSTPIKTYALNLVLVEVRYPVNDNPRQRSTKIDQFVHHKGHDSGGNDVVGDIGIPCRPHPLENIKVNIVLGDVFELTPVRIGRG